MSSTEHPHAQQDRRVRPIHVDAKNENEFSRISHALVTISAGNYYFKIMAGKVWPDGPCVSVQRKS